MTAKEAKEITLESKVIISLISTADFSGVNYIMVDSLSKQFVIGLIILDIMFKVLLLVLMNPMKKYLGN